MRHLASPLVSLACVLPRRRGRREEGTRIKECTLLSDPPGFKPEARHYRHHDPVGAVVLVMGAGALSVDHAPLRLHAPSPVGYCDQERPDGRIPANGLSVYRTRWLLRPGTPGRPNPREWAQCVPIHERPPRG